MAEGHLVDMACQARIDVAFTLCHIQVSAAVLCQADVSGKAADVGTEESDHPLLVSARAVYAIQLLQKCRIHGSLRLGMNQDKICNAFHRDFRSVAR